MVLEPVPYQWFRKDDGAMVDTEGYALPDVLGLVIGVHHPWEHNYTITQTSTGLFVLSYFHSLSDAARHLELLGALCDWREVESKNGLFRALGPVIAALENRRFAVSELRQAVEDAADTKRHLDELTLRGLAAVKGLEAALVTFRGQA